MMTRLMRDTISVQKQDGNKIVAIKASVQPGKIFAATTALINVGDLIERRMSNGGAETYEVIDPVFYEKGHQIPAHYQIVVKKLGVPEAAARIQSITYNISGHNARVNQDSVDNSSNNVTIGADLQQYVEALRQTVATLDSVQREEATDLVDALEQNLTSAKPSKKVISTLLDSLSHIANIGTIATSILALI
ncbi:hypothetical protein CSV86_009505 [Pseudomonas putida CSV86]|uniref:Uncharacterized protein n=1 Tax=Pseudomonas bharatica CSV86 TaxID=1005395 RepID=L1LU55_9PSED|nr:hypothetical protein [Pseudomonas bharatica]NNJ15451.1 hypothetical protein [Pseudomonas bharatica CSV86]